MCLSDDIYNEKSNFEVKLATYFAQYSSSLLHLENDQQTHVSEERINGKVINVA